MEPRRFGAFASGNVDDRGKHEGALRGPDRTEADFNWDLRAVLPEGIELSVRAHRPRMGVPQEARPVLRMFPPKAVGDEHLDRLTQEFLTGVSEQQLRLSVDEDHLALVVHHENGVGRRLDHESESLFGPLTFGDIHDRGQHERSLLGLERIQPDLDRNFGAVFPKTEEFSAGPHRTGVGISKEGAPMVGMGAAKPLGNELLDGFPEELRSHISEELLSLGVDKNDPPQVIHHDHGVWGGFDGQTEEFVSRFPRAHWNGPILDTEASIASLEMLLSELKAMMFEENAFHFVEGKGSACRKKHWRIKCRSSGGALAMGGCWPKASRMSSQTNPEGFQAAMVKSERPSDRKCGSDAIRVLSAS